MKCTDYNALDEPPLVVHLFLFTCLKKYEKVTASSYCFAIAQI